jgi:hypothetical protein
MTHPHAVHIVAGDGFGVDVDRPLGKALLFLVLVRVGLLRVAVVLALAARRPGTGGAHRWPCRCAAPFTGAAASSSAAACSCAHTCV